MVPPKGAYLPISKLHSILAVANLLAHNNKSQICYCGQISLQSAAVNCSFSDTFGGNIYFAGDLILASEEIVHVIYECIRNTFQTCVVAVATDLINTQLRYFLFWITQYKKILN